MTEESGANHEEYLQPLTSYNAKLVSLQEKFFQGAKQSTSKITTT